MQDIEAVDPDFYKNLRWMLENDIADVLDLTFTEETDYFGRKELVELKPEGANLRVTDANKREYVNLVAQHRMTTVIKGQINAFLAGFWDLVPKVRVCACISVVARGCVIQARLNDQGKRLSFLCLAQAAQTSASLEPEPARARPGSLVLLLL